MGAGKKWDYRQLSHQIESHTGGIYFSPFLDVHHSDLSKFTASVYFHSYCLDRNVTKMFDLLRDIFMERPNFNDFDRLESIVSMRTASLQDSLISSGHSYARINAASHFSEALSLNEKWEGLHQVTLMQELARKVKSNSGSDGAKEQTLRDLARKFEQLADYVFSGSPFLRFNIVSEESALCAAEHSLESTFLRNIDQANQLQPNASEYVSCHFESEEDHGESGELVHRHFHEVPSSVSFVAQAIPTAVPYNHADSPKLRVNIIELKIILNFKC